MAAQNYPPVQHPVVDRQGNVTRPWLTYLNTLGGQAQAASTVTTSAVTETGTITPGHIAVWAADGVIEDGGPVPSSGVGGVTQLTGDVTAGPGTGSLVASIAADAVTFAKLQNLNTQTLVGRDSAGAGDPEAVTVSQVLDWLTT